MGLVDRSRGGGHESYYDIALLAGRACYEMQTVQFRKVIVLERTPEMHVYPSQYGNKNICIDPQRHEHANLPHNLKLPAPFLA